MNAAARFFCTLAASTAILLVVACAPTMTTSEGAIAARDKLLQLQADPQLATRAPLAIEDAELAVRAAEVPQQDKALEQHLVFLADRKVDIAWARARSRLLEDQRNSLSQEREGARLDARTSEVDRARADAELARSQTDTARKQSAELQKQIEELNAKPTDRGLVITLGNVLFANGRSELKGGALDHLGNLVVFLNRHPDRTVIIEGHTDNVGREDSNHQLSQRRADSVKSFLIGQNVSPVRITASGMGEAFAVADNNTASGRAQNRRVEIIISNPTASR